MKKRFKELVQSAGYTSIGKLATLNRLSPQNLYSHIGKHPREATIKIFADLLGKKPGEVQASLVYEQEIKDAELLAKGIVRKKGKLNKKTTYCWNCMVRLATTPEGLCGACDYLRNKA